MAGCYMPTGTMPAIDPKRADKRTAERYIRFGLLDEKEYEKHLKALPDLTDKSAPVEVDLDEYALDEDELE
jgi:hypothetical protein